MMLGTAQLSAIAVSEAIAVWLIWKLWRSGDHLFFKVSLTLLALIPFVGPLAVLWITHFPPPQPLVFRDTRRMSADVYERWRHVFEEKNPVKRFHKWRELVGNPPPAKGKLMDEIATAAVITDLPDADQSGGGNGGGD